VNKEKSSKDFLLIFLLFSKCKTYKLFIEKVELISKVFILSETEELIAF